MIRTFHDEEQDTLVHLATRPPHPQEAAATVAAYQRSTPNRVLWQLSVPGFLHSAPFFAAALVEAMAARPQFANRLRIALVVNDADTRALLLEHLRRAQQPLVRAVFTDRRDAFVWLGSQSSGATAGFDSLIGMRVRFDEAPWSITAIDGRSHPKWVTLTQSRTREQQRRTLVEVLEPAADTVDMLRGDL